MRDERTAYIAYPTDNPLGIPALALAHCATHIPLPIRPWGTIPRRRIAEAYAAGKVSTIHFYEADYKFARLPLQLPAGIAAVEPNYSTDDTRAETICAVLRKRRIAWHWAMSGARIIADLYVSIEHLDIAVTGLPLGWRAYAWRAHASDPIEEWEARYDIAARIAGAAPLILVLGGGTRAAEWCRRRACIHIPISVWADDQGAKTPEQSQRPSNNSAKSA